MSDYTLNTKCVQAGYTPGNGEPRQIPIIQSTTFKYDTSEDMGKLFDLEASGYFYSRLQNPTNDYVAAKIAELEGGAAANSDLKEKDIITKVDGTEIAGTSDLSEVIEGKKPGDTVELEVYRPSQRPNGEGRFFNITVALMEDMGDTTAQQPQTQQVPQQEQQPSEDQYYNCLLYTYDAADD